jgi:hypothetical protein
MDDLEVGERVSVCCVLDVECCMNRDAMYGHEQCTWLYTSVAELPPLNPT